jgi:hypothetical protein
MEISNQKDINIYNNAIVSLQAGRLALIVVNIILSLKYKRNLQKAKKISLF